MFSGQELYMLTMASLNQSQGNNTFGNPGNATQTFTIVKAGLYFIDFVFISAMSILIIKTVRQNSKMKKEVRYFLLCHHLLCSSLFCCFGMLLNVISIFEVAKIWMWIIFGIQAAIGESVLVTLALMALNICLAVCWPLRYLAFVHSVKNKVIVCVWFGTVLKAVCLILIERTDNNPMDKFAVEPSCPTILGGNFARISGLVLISLLAATIVTAYIFLCKEGKLTGHFNCSNKKARKTITIHGLQMSFHILPPLIIKAIGQETEHRAITFGAFVIFLFAQSFSPLVYGLRNKELQEKICRTRRQYSNYLVNNNDNPPQLQMTENGETTLQRCLKGNE